MEPIELSEKEKPASFTDDIKDIKDSLEFVESRYGTYVVAVANRVDGSDSNIEFKPVFGEPISDVVYNTVRNCYHLTGTSCHYIGRISIGYRAVMAGASWSTDVPLPESVIKRYMSDYQRASFETWAEKYEDPKYRIVFVQSVGVF